VVALTEDIQATHKDTKQSILLKRGQVGTVLIEFNGETHLVDFSDSQGHTYAMETILDNKLMLLIYEPTEAYV
jgi:hypothetical protein